MIEIVGTTRRNERLNDRERNFMKWMGLNMISKDVRKSCLYRRINKERFIKRTRHRKRKINKNLSNFTHRRYYLN